MSEYRARQLAALVALRDAHLEAFPSDTVFPVQVACWMGHTYFEAWLPVNQIKIDGGMSTFDTVLVTVANVDVALRDIEVEFEGTGHRVDQQTSQIPGEEYPHTLTYTGPDGDGDVIMSTVKRARGQLVDTFAIECGWVWKF
jgi:hypothetical protein